MSAPAYSISFHMPLSGGATPGQGYNHHPEYRKPIAASSRSAVNEGTVMRSNGLIGRTDLGRERKNTSLRDPKLANQNWLSAQIAKRPVGEVVNSTGMSDKAVQNIRQRKCKISFDNLVDLCRADPDFAAAFAKHVGLIREGEAEFVAALTKAENAFQRMKAAKEGAEE